MVSTTERGLALGASPQVISINEYKTIKICSQTLHNKSLNYHSLAVPTSKKSLKL